MKTTEMYLTLNLKEVSENLQNLPDNIKVKFVIDLGQNGDLTYELKLLQELCKLISNVYPLKSMNNDDELTPVVKSLLRLKDELKFLNNE